MAWLAAVSACAAAPATLPCTVALGGSHRTIDVVAKDGAVSTASVGGYSVTFTVHATSPQISAKVTNSNGRTLLSASGGRLGGFSGSAPTPDGELDFSCGP